LIAALSPNASNVLDPIRFAHEVVTVLIAKEFHCKVAVDPRPQSDDWGELEQYP
jgi:hypothetical protein